MVTHVGIDDRELGALNGGIGGALFLACGGAVPSPVVRSREAAAARGVQLLTFHQLIE